MPAARRYFEVDINLMLIICRYASLRFSPLYRRNLYEIMGIIASVIGWKPLLIMPAELQSIADCRTGR